MLALTFRVWFWGFVFCLTLATTRQSNSHEQTDTSSSARTEAHTQQQQAGREASWKEVRKVKRVVKSEKWVTRTRGGKVKNFGENKLWNKIK